MRRATMTVAGLAGLAASLARLPVRPWRAIRSRSSARRPSFPTPGGRRAVLSEYRRALAGGRSDRHRRRHADVLRGHRQRLRRHHRRLARIKASEWGLCDQNGVDQRHRGPARLRRPVDGGLADGRGDATSPRRSCSARSPPRSRSTARWSPIPTGAGARSTRRCPTSRSWSTARRRPRARATPGSSS